MIDHQVLKNEMATDPQGYGYGVAYTERDLTVLREMLNLARDGTNGGPAITIRKGNLSIQDLYESVTMSDMPSLSGSPNAAALSRERQLLAWFIGLSSLQAVRILNNDGSSGPVAINLLDMFPAGSATRNRLIAIASRFGSRVEELFGEGAAVTTLDVATAWDLP